MCRPVRFGPVCFILLVLLLHLLAGASAQDKEVLRKSGDAIVAPSGPNVVTAALSWNQRGVAAYQTQDYPAALNCFKNAVSLNHNSILYVINLAAVEQSLGRFPDALNLLDDALTASTAASDQAKIKAAVSDLRFQWAQFFLKTQRYDEAISQYKSAIEGDQNDRPESASADLNLLGRLYDSLGRYDTAIQSFQRALVLSRQCGSPSMQGVSLNNLGIVFNHLSQYDRAIEYFQEALPIRRRNKDRAGEGSTLSNLGSAYASLSQYDEALDYLQQGFTAQREAQDREGQGSTLNQIGLVHLYLSRYDQAVDCFSQALAFRRALNNQSGAAVTLSNLGCAYDDLGQYEKALDEFQQALKINTDLKELPAQSTTLNNLGLTSSHLSRYETALEFYGKALAIERDVKDRHGEAITLINVGDANEHLSRYDVAAASFRAALPILRDVKDRFDEAKALNGLGNVSGDLAEYPEALASFQQALALERETKDRDGEAATLSDMGDVQEHLGRYAEASELLQQARSLCHETKNKAGESTAWNNLGNTNLGWGRFEAASAAYREALAIEEMIGDRAGEAKAWSNLGIALDDLSRYSEALHCYQQALPLAQAVKDDVQAATIIMNSGNVHLQLGQYPEAVASFQQALSLYRQTQDRKNEGSILSNLGQAYMQWRQFDKALSYSRQALPLMRAAKNRAGEGSLLNNLGQIYVYLVRYPEADSCFQQALAVSREIQSPVLEATCLHNLGNLYYFSKDERAVPLIQEGLTLARQTENRALEAEALASLMGVSQNLMEDPSRLARPKLAIFYGKQAANVYQSIRADAQTLDRAAQSSYVLSVQDTYRRLADLLIGQGRLTEAQQVLRLLKEREFYDFLNPDPNAPPPAMDSLILTKREHQWTTAYDKAALPLTDLRAQEQTLLVKKGRTPEEDTELAKLESQITQATVALTNVQKQIAPAFSGPQTADDAPPLTTGAGDVQHALAPGTVALYTIVAPDRLNLILITPTAQKAYTSAVTADALYQKVLTLRRALTNPDVDPTGPAADLYRLVLGPVQKDLDAAHATTILFSLDDALRYVPPAVLYDPTTKQYVAERYRTELITLAGAAPDAPPSATLSVLGLGVSTSQDGAPALPGVAAELAAIVHDPEQNDTGGLVPGKRLLDAQFTRSALEDGLKTGGYPLVHLASHFALHGTQDTSYLLLGDGSHLSVSELARDPHRFKGVGLLTLSACDTAMEVKRSSGREVEGIATLAQSLGAKAVLASLWPVSDAATPPLMTALYGYRQAHPAAPLSEALQAAQWTLLHGQSPVSGDLAHRGTEAVSASTGESLPVFVPDPKVPYAHPYYWAPFILIGNWK